MEPEKGPPSGGYGLHPTPRAPDPKPTLPAMSPFRTAPVDAAAPMRSKRWIGLPILGIALLSVRMLFLCARTNEPSYAYEPLFTPLTLPTMTFAPPATPPTMLGAMAIGADGTTYFVKNGELYSQAKDAPAPTWMLAGSGAIRDVRVAGDAIYVLDGLGLRRVSGVGAAYTVASGTFSAMMIEGNDAYVLLPSAIQKVNLANGSLATIASTDPDKGEDLTGPLVSAEGWLWFGQGENIGRIAKKADHQMIGKPFASLSMLSLAAAPDAVLVATIDGVSDIAGGKVRTLTPDGWGTACHDVIAAGKYVYFTYRDEAGWAVGRMKREGGAVDPVVHTVIQPKLATRAGAVVWSTPEGVRRAPELD